MRSRISKVYAGIFLWKKQRTDGDDDNDAEYGGFPDTLRVGEILGALFMATTARPWSGFGAVDSNVHFDHTQLLSPLRSVGQLETNVLLVGPGPYLNNQSQLKKEKSDLWFVNNDLHATPTGQSPHHWQDLVQKNLPSAHFSLISLACGKRQFSIKNKKRFRNGSRPRGYRDPLLETAQEAVTIAYKCGHRWAQVMWPKIHSLSVCIWF